MALASKDYMERLAAELKEKEEQEKIKKMRLNTRPQTKPQGLYWCSVDLLSINIIVLKMVMT